MSQYNRAIKILIGILFALFILLMFSGVLFPESLWADQAGVIQKYKRFVASVAGWMVLAQLVWFFSALLAIWKNARFGGMLLVSYFAVFALIDALNGPFVATPPVSFLDDMTSFLCGSLAALAFVMRRNDKPAQLK